MARAIALALAVAIPLAAEFLRIDLAFEPMDCASCAEFLSNKLTKYRGVERVELDRDKGKLHVELKPDNRLRIGIIRDFLEQGGFRPRDAVVHVRGRAIEQNGEKMFELWEGGAALRLRGGPAPSTAMITGEGTVPAPARRGEPDAIVWTSPSK